MDDIKKIFFSMYLHTKNFDYDCLKYDYSVPKFKKQEFKIFVINNKFQFDKYRQYNRKNIVLLALLNNLYRPSLEIDGNLDLKEFYRDITQYKNIMEKDVEYLVSNLEDIEDIYTFYRKKEISWFSFYYVIKYLKFDRSKHITNELFKNKLRHYKKITMILDFKDYITYTEYFDSLQKKVDLMLD